MEAASGERVHSLSKLLGPSAATKIIQGESAMKESWKWISAVAVSALIALLMIAPGLRAGANAKGKFTLPFEAKWGMVALSTGDYKFSVDHIDLDGSILVTRGAQTVGILHAQAFDERENQSKNPELVCIRHDGKVTVRALRLPEVGTFYFALPKELKTLVAQQPQLIETVSVQVSGE
jgi:hypothetical protein